LVWHCLLGRHATTWATPPAQFPHLFLC
jgi:hypothetical protein